MYEYNMTCDGAAHRTLRAIQPFRVGESGMRLCHAIHENAHYLSTILANSGELYSSDCPESHSAVIAFVVFRAVTAQSGCNVVVC